MARLQLRSRRLVVPSQRGAPGLAPLLLPLLLALPLAAGANCPCQNPALCNPITHRLNFEVTFDVPWSSNCVAGRCYNYTEIAYACDFLFVMSYDERSLPWSQCIAGANSPYTQTLTGYEDYIKIGISPKKLVMGIPWYGVDYTCQNLSKDKAGHFHQVWYDNPQSISLKAAYVQNRGLLGIGMWHANCLDYSEDATAKKQTEEMWKALRKKL
ncbi:di-N-acetylchitobiase precursor [Camelus ferus]|nr:di-N-acetylchitobiase precursor [Camelus ferus]